MLIDQFMPDYNVTEHHTVSVDAPPARVYETMLDTDVFGSAIVRALFFVRALPMRLSRHGAPLVPRKATLNTLLGEEATLLRFTVLADSPPQEFVLGTVIRIQAAFHQQEPLPGPSEFLSFHEPGAFKIVMNLHLTENSDGTTQLETDTRVHCLDAKTRRRFHVYWFFVGPFSGLVRIFMLRAMKQEAERPQQ